MSRNTQTSKDHHYIPKAILRCFCFSGNTTYYLSRKNKVAAVERRNIDSIFKRRHFNSLTMPDGRRDDRVERFFAYAFDDFIPEWTSGFNKSISTGEEIFKSSSDRDRFVQFFFNHTKRSPDFIEPIVRKATEQTFHSGFIDEVERNVRSLSDEEKGRLSDPKTQNIIANNSRVFNLGKQSETVLDRLASLRIFVAVPRREKKTFIVGANPVIRFESHPGQPLGEEGVELWTTLTPNIAVGFAKSDVGGEVLYLDDAQVRKINATLALQSSAIASNSETLLQSLSRAVW